MALLCDTYGLDSAARAARVAWTGLRPEDRRWADVLHGRVIGPHVDSFLHAFHAELQKLPEFADLTRGYAMSDLRAAHRQYLMTLGRDFDTEAYFEGRLRVGLAHIRVGVPLGLYHAAYGTLQRLLVEWIQELADVSGVARELARFVLKISALDLALASEAYYLAQVRGLQRSLAESQLAEHELRHRATRDSLTGLSNRDFILISLDDALADAKSRRTPLCVIMADLDHFKDVNDTYGHQVGDTVLRHVTDRMASVLRATDVLGRYGGEEFLVLLRDTGMATARRVAERMRRRVGDGPIEAGALRIPMTISAGLAEVRPAESPSSVIGRADQALYVAKQAGRNRVALADVRSSSHPA